VSGGGLRLEGGGRRNKAKVSGPVRRPKQRHEGPKNGRGPLLNGLRERCPELKGERGVDPNSSLREKGVERVALVSKGRGALPRRGLGRALNRRLLLMVGEGDGPPFIGSESSGVGRRQDDGAGIAEKERKNTAKKNVRNASIRRETKRKRSSSNTEVGWDPG